MRLADPERSRVILIGTATYQDPTLPDIPAVRHNVEALGEVFRDPALGGLAEDSCRTLVDSTWHDAIEKVSDWCGEAQDVLVVYFSGHGLVGSDGSLLLAFSDTKPENRVTAVRISDLRLSIQESPALTRVLILDCCYSGRAIPALGAAQVDLLGELDIKGTYTLTSAPRDLRSLYREGERYTVFSGELISTLRDGIAAEPVLLSVDAVYRHLRRTMRHNNLPEPKQLHSDSASALALVRNAAFVGADSNNGVPDPGRDPFDHADVLVRRAGEDQRDRLVLASAARDRRWPALARLRMAGELARLAEVDAAAAVLESLGGTRAALVGMTDFMSLLENDELWDAPVAEPWNAAGLTDDPGALWGLLMAMWLSLSGMPRTRQLDAAVELASLGHREQTEHVLRGMLRHRVITEEERRAVQAKLKSL